MRLLIVESPTKAKKIRTWLGSEWNVKASLGHIRDLPVHELGVSLSDFSVEYVFSDRSKKVVADLRKLAKEASEIYLGTDPDREGEAIAWHLREVLGLSRVRRVRFDEITKGKVIEAIAAPTSIDERLVAAQEARRVLDRLVGYRVSPAISDRIGQRLSAGRVQTPALRLIVEREREIRNFVPRDHFGVVIAFEGWTADWDFKPLLPDGEDLWIDGKVAAEVAMVRDVVVLSRTDRESKSAPPPAFKTATLQQAASVTLKIDPDIAMKYAQALFEGGHITYHRTDDVNLSTEAITAIREYAQQKGLALPVEPRRWKAAQNAQEAHEGIRPTHFEIEQLPASGCDCPNGAHDEAERAFYAMIWKRAVASQLADAVFDVREVRLRSAAPFSESHAGVRAEFVARGRVLRKPGWKALTPKDAVDEDDAEDVPNPIPELSEGTALRALDGKCVPKRTQPKSRYTKASLIAELEKRGIGRPATYASITKTLDVRGYVAQDGKRRLAPTQLGEVVVDALVGRFSFADCGFTAGMETELDKIAGGQRTYLDLARGTNTILDNELALLASANIARVEREGIKCPVCGVGLLTKRKGQYGTFWSCDAYRSNGCKAHFPDKRGKPDLSPRPKVDENAPTCPECKKGKLVQRQGKRGPFWGCTEFKNGCRALFDKPPNAA